MPGSIFEFVDFRGGYSTDVPSPLMSDAEMLQADNVTWDNGLAKRKGHKRYASVVGSLTRGSIRVDIEGVWRTIRAVEGTTSGAPAKNTTLEIGTTTAFSTITRASETAYAVTNGQDVQFARLGDSVVAVNGVDPPTLVYSTGSAVFAETYERYDTRDVDDAFWFAGQYSSATADGNYATNSANAQSSTSLTFELCAPSVGAGFWVSSDEVFNLPSVIDSPATVTATFSFEYLGRPNLAASTTWVSYTPNDVPTWTAVGDREMEFDLPINKGEFLLDTGPDSLPSPLAGRFCWRAVDRTADPLAVSFKCKGLSVENSQHLRQVYQGYVPHSVVEQGSKLWLAADEIVVFGSQLHQILLSFEPGNFEFFLDGGSIQSLHPGLARNGVVVLMDSGIHTIQSGPGGVDRVDRNQVAVGVVGPRAAVAHNRALYYLSGDGIYVWDGLKATKISKHIQSDIDSWTLSDACASVHEDKILFSFPTNSIILEFDPDTFRADAEGDGRVSFYKHTGVSVDQFQWNSAEDDNGLLLGIDNVNRYYLKLYDGTGDAADHINSTTTIAYAMQSKYYHFDSYHTPKIFRRPTFRVADVSHTGGDDYTIKIFTQNQYGESSTTATLTASVASGIHTASVGVPPHMDGYNFGFGVQHDTKYDAKFFGVSLEVEEKAQ
jgi:hypothetical protein